MSRPRWPLPSWLLRPVGAGELEIAKTARQDQVLVVGWRHRPEDRGARPGAEPAVAWARRQGWRISRWKAWWSAEDAFLDAMLEDEARYELALRESGVELFVPKARHEVSAAELQELDELYAATETMGALGRRPTRWGELVEELRVLRRAVEAGVVLEVEGREIRSWGQFYGWAHGRYHGLEDGVDAWIGDDR